MAVPIVAAFLVEYVFYLIPGFEKLREWLADRIPVRALAGSMALSALAPYLIYSLPTGQFHAAMFTRLAAWVLVVCFWYVWQRPSPVADCCVLAMFVAPLIGRFFHYIYISPASAVSIDILGKLMLIRLAASVMLLLREVEGAGFGFLPTAQEWKIGLRYFAWSLPVGLALSAALGLIHWRPTSAGVMAAPVVFLGVFWVLALSEEFLARGLLQRWISDWTGSENIGLIAATILFGLSHLWFRFAFP